MSEIKHSFEDNEKVIIKETGEVVTVDIWWKHDLSNTIRYNIKEHPFTWLSEWELEKVPTT